MAPSVHDDEMVSRQSAVNRTRLMESVVIAVVTGAISMAGSYFWTVPTLTAQVGHLSQSIEQMRIEIGALKLGTVQNSIDITRLQEQVSAMQRASEQRLQRLEEHVFGYPRGRKG